MDYDEKEREIKKQLRADQQAGREPTVEPLAPFKIPDVLKVIDYQINSVNEFKVGFFVTTKFMLRTQYI